MLPFYKKDLNQKLYTYLKSKTFCQLYLKYIARAKLNNNTTTLDNSNALTPYKSLVQVGKSLKSKEILYKNKFNKQLNFYWVNKININNFVIRKHINNIIEINWLIVLSPYRGGYTSYSTGIKGILPMHETFKIFIYLFKKQGKFNLFYLLSEFFRKKNTSKYFLMRLPISNVKVSAYPLPSKYNFSSSKKKKLYKNYLNFIFYFSKKKLNEKTKTFKTTRKYDFKKRNTTL